MHKWTHAHSHTCGCTYAHPTVCTYTGAYTCAHIHRYIHTYTHRNTQVHTSPPTSTRMHTQVHTYTRMYTRACTCPYTGIYIRTCTRIYVCIYKRMHIQTHARTHTHTQSGSHPIPRSTEALLPSALDDVVRPHKIPAWYAPRGTVTTEGHSYPESTAPSGARMGARLSPPRAGKEEETKPPGPFPDPLTPILLWPRKEPRAKG